MHPKYLKALLSVFVPACFTAAGFAQPAEQPIKLDTSVVFARGDYGLASDTDVFIAMVNPTYETADWRVQASLPYVHLKGPATVVGNTGSAQSYSASGIGDASLGVARKLGTAASGWATSVGARVKFPTADENKGLGTGETDTTVQIDVLKSGGTLTPFGTVGYQFLGHNANYPMKSGLFATAGVTSKIASGVVLGLAGNWRERIIEGGDQGVEAMGFVQHDLGESSHVQLFVLHGFTDASPNIAVGLTLGFKM